MAKRLKFPVRSLGSEVPAPQLTSLAQWIAEHRGIEADLTTYLIDQSILPQKEAGIDILCPGGLFYKNRIIESIEGIDQGVVNAEVGANVSRTNFDATMIALSGKGIWMAFPAPHMLALEDAYYGDPEELSHSLCLEYRRLMRSMRDAGISGHIILGEKAVDTEIEAFHSRKTVYYVKNPDISELETIAAYQPILVVPAASISKFQRVIEDNPGHRIVLLDPSDHELRVALENLDPDKIIVGGFCEKSCSTYWQALVSFSHEGIIV